VTDKATKKDKERVKQFDCCGFGKRVLSVFLRTFMAIIETREWSSN